MASDTVPQWKKDLILRKRAQGGGGANRSVRSTAAVGSAPATQQHERCDARASVNENTSTSDSEPQQTGPPPATAVKMVQDSVSVVNAPPAATNGGCCAADDSDSSEELQYGPGIVSKLKSKYLSLTLREASAKPRPSILPLRRATSLENMLDDSADAEDEVAPGRRATVGAPPTSTRRYQPRAAPLAPRTQNTRYRTTTRGNDSVKRARSVEGLVRSTEAAIAPPAGSDAVVDRKRVDKPTPVSVNGTSGGQRINRPKRIAPLMDETERPPADHVKHTLMLFEGPPARRTRAPRPTGDVAAKVANFKHIIDLEKQNNNNSSLVPAPPTPPPMVTRPTKPLVTTPKPTVAARRSPVKRPAAPSVPPPASPVLRPSPIPDVSSDVAATPRAPTTLSETPDLIVHSSPSVLPPPALAAHSPTTLKNITADFLQAEVKCAQSDVNSAKNKVNKVVPSVVPLTPTPAKSTPVSRSPSPRAVVDGPEREITKQAVENISKAGMTVTYRFPEPAVKSHLPRLHTVPVRINRLVADTPSKPQAPTPATTPAITPQTNGTGPRRPIVSPVPLAALAPTIPLPTSPEPLVVAVNKAAVLRAPPGVPLARPPTPAPAPPVPKAALTSREIEKNSLNKQKTLEQPVSKVVVSVRSLDEVVANKNVLGGRKSRGGHEQTTVLFNFQQRDTIPDYIATDGSANVRRGKREKPKPGESGIILLPGAPAEEFADDDEDWMLSLNGPPSPCDVHFENDNILIDGRSSISKQPKRQKMRIQFDDDATQVFEYLSEASALEDGPASPAVAPITSPPTLQAGHAVPSLTGSSLANYTPSKMSMASDFELGVTRGAVVTPPTLATAPGPCPSPTPTDALLPVTYSAETTADILF